MITLNHIKAIFTFTFVFIMGATLAQTPDPTPDLEIDTQSSGSVTVCGDAVSFTVVIHNISGALIQNIKVYPQMPSGMLYVAGSAQSMTEVLPVNFSDPSFSVTDLADGNQKTLHFQAKADCSLIEALRTSGSTTNLINNDTKVTYTLAALPGVLKEIKEPNGSESYSVLYPQLELFVPESEKNQAAPFINKVMNRHITIKNTGLGRLSSLDFYLKTDLELTVDKLELITPSGNQVLNSGFFYGTLGKKYTITDFSSIGNGDAFLDEGEEVNLIDYVKATAGKGAIATTYTTQWGCLNSVCNPEDRQAQFAAYVEAIGGNPSQPKFDGQVLSKTDFCTDPATVRWNFLNEGSGNSPATRDAGFNVMLLIDLNSPLTTDNHSFYINHSDGSLVPIDNWMVPTETVQNNGSFTNYYKRYSFQLKDVFTSDPDGEGGFADVDGDSFFDDWPVGNTLSITAKFSSKLKSQNEFIFIYSSSCSIFYQNWSGNYLSWGFTGGSVYLNNLSAKLTGASDLTNGKRETIHFELREYNNSSILRTQDATFKFNLTVPQGVVVRSAKWNNTNLPYTQAGNTVSFFTPLFKAPSYTTVDFEYELDCSKAVPGALVGDITLDMLYYFNKNCSDFFRVASASKQMFLHCGSSCSTVETTLFTAERTTLGWPTPTSPNYRFYKYGDLFAASPKVNKLTRTAPGIRLDAAYPKDEVEVSVQGRAATTITNLSAEIKYTAPVNKEVLHYVSAQFVLNGSSYPIAVDAAKIIQDSTYKYTLNIPLGTGSIPIQLVAGTVFELKIKYKVDELEGVDRGEYPMVDFRGRFFTVVNGSASNCLGFGDDFLLFKPKNESSNVSFTLTDKGRMSISYFRFYGGNNNVNYSIPDFPNEFRPIFYANTQVITLPKGYVFDPSQPVQFSIGAPGTLASGNTFNLSGAQFSNNNRTITIPRNADTPLMDYLDMYFTASAKADCENPDNKFIPVTTVYDVRKPVTNNYQITSYAYLQPSEQVTSAVVTCNSDVYNWRRPNLQLTTNSVQEGFGETVTWPVQVCNPQMQYSPTMQNSLHTWIAFELKSDDHSTVLQQVLDGDNKSLELVYYGLKDADHPNGRNVLVKLDIVKLTSCTTLKVVATYKNCQEDRLQNIDVYASWDYQDYPEVSSYTGSVVDRRASCEGYLYSGIMTIKYKTAELQWEVRKNGPVEVDLCVATPFEIDLASTKFGDMKQLKVFVNLPASAAIDPDSYQYHYPYHSPAVDVPADALLEQDGKIGIDISKLIGGNLPGIHSNDNKVKLAFNITTRCGFDPGLPIKYTVNGYTNCGDYIEFTDQRKIRLSGLSATALDSLELALTGPPSLTCNSDNEISLNIKNLRDSPSTYNKLEIVLPSGTSFKEITAGDLPAPFVVTENNQVKLQWTLTDGYLSAQASKSLTLKTFLSQTPVGTIDVLFVARTYISADGHCVESNAPCNMQVTSARDELSVQVSGLASLNITKRRYICAYQFKPSIDPVGDCAISAYAWNFGDGATSSEAKPFHSFGTSGTYTVSLHVNFNCGGCNGVQSKQIQVLVLPGDALLSDTTIQVLTDLKKQVLHVSASTFSDTWPTQHVDSDLDAKQSFLNGTQGVWRNEGSYVYETPRSASEHVKIAQDGTFNLDQFNWQLADVGAIPGWIKATSMTQYSPYSYELENRDVLGIYSAALYDYGGHLPSANGVNMRNAEMAFTSFESFDRKSSGNWIFGTQPIPSYYLYKVQAALGNTAIVEASMRQLDDAHRADVSARRLINPFLFLNQIPFLFNYVTNDEIVCKQRYSINPDWSIVVFKEAPFNNLWKGQIKVTNTIVPIISPDIDSTFAHSGKYSLKITADKTFKQNLLQLDSGKSYLICAWVFVNNVSVISPTLDDSLGIDVVIRNKQGQKKLTKSFAPSGQVIEGWQQVKGTFTYTGGNGATLELKFRKGKNTSIAWYDDLRLHPENGNMKSYVYSLTDYRLRAILDEENFASFFYYDAEGNLYLTKKETEGGIKTITESISYQKENLTK